MLHVLSAPPRRVASAAAPLRRVATAAALPARLVLNHSTHAPDLIPLLTESRALFGAAGVSTITPGRITRTSGNSHSLSLVVAAPLAHDSGFRVLARRGSSLQEVFFTCPKLSADELQALLDSALERAR